MDGNISGMHFQSRDRRSAGEHEHVFPNGRRAIVPDGGGIFLATKQQRAYSLEPDAHTNRQTCADEQRLEKRMKALCLCSLAMASAALAADTSATQTNAWRPALEINAGFA